MNKIPRQLENPKGLHRRYYIQKIVRANGPFDDGESNYKLIPVDEDAEYFVLRLDEGGKDPEHIKACRIGVNAYADAIAHHLPELAKDLKERYPLSTPINCIHAKCPSCGKDLDIIPPKGTTIATASSPSTREGAKEVSWHDLEKISDPKTWLDMYHHYQELLMSLDLEKFGTTRPSIEPTKEMGEIKHWKEGQLQRALDKMNKDLDRLAELEIEVVKLRKYETAALKLAASNFKNQSAPTREGETELIEYFESKLAEQRTICADAFWNNRLKFIDLISLDNVKLLMQLIENSPPPNIRIPLLAHESGTTPTGANNVADSKK